VPHRSLPLFSLVTAALLVGVAACGDDPVQPDIFAGFAEAEAALRSASALPSLGEVVGGTPAASPARRAALIRAQELWSGSAPPHGRDGLAQRQRASALAAPILAELRTPEDLLSIRGRVDEWARTVELLTAHLVLPAVQERLRAARIQLARADGATTADLQVYHVLLAMSELVETTPAFVARALVDEADRAVGRAESALDAGPAEDNVARARRLADWSARAVDEADYLRAIQRAYYAIQLVESR
jgi:hypothetical protein